MTSFLYEVTTILTVSRTAFLVRLHKVSDIVHKIISRNTLPGP